MSLLTNLNGVIAASATVSVLDRGFLYGDSIYEVVRTFQGRHFGLQEHLDRLRQSAEYLYMEVPWSDPHIQAEVERTLQQAPWQESYIRIVVSRGTETKISLQPSPGLQPSLLIVASEISPEPILSEKGIHLVISERLRNDRQALSPAAKTGNYLNNILALLEAQQQGAEDALMLNQQGEITEATTSNLWIVRGGVVQTPPADVGILKGITRHFLWRILQTHGIPCEEVILKPEDLWSAEEAFLSSSVRLMMPVNRINGYRLPQCPGKLTRFLWDEFLRLMAQESYAIAKSAESVKV
ncbi:aminotransferase class IV [Acaryochloris sp. CCMEE 5410]|uniref:aminotransferase class IV n=1 Tax=Acaryochloris sp. CCMEE 5410 TaxID=310037 RepID=UPI000248414D|nr:aminotransferase class IV [Acaryochloris sp. CCMEE 5410]KAI9133892.1 aminotransferase class IV [Acaryochloris sp. CCMEE 5410]